MKQSSTIMSFLSTSPINKGQRDVGYSEKALTSVGYLPNCFLKQLEK